MDGNEPHNVQAAIFAKCFLFKNKSYFGNQKKVIESSATVLLVSKLGAECRFAEWYILVEGDMHPHASSLNDFVILITSF